MAMCAMVLSAMATDLKPVDLLSSALTHGFEGVSRLAAGSVVSGLWQGAVLAAGVGLCLRVMPKTTAALRFAIWTVVFGVLALLPVVHAYLAYPGRVPGAGAVHGAMVNVDERWSMAIALLWLGVSLFRGVGLVAGAMRLRGVWKRAVPVESFGGENAALITGRRGARLCTSSKVDRPSVIGFLAPRILIPQELFSRLTATELEQIVLHEMGHLRRGDDWVNLLQKIALVLIPLNPVLLWIERRLCLERELACDDDVLLLTKAPKAYATCLTSLAEHRLAGQVASLSLGAWERRSQLACRVERILSRGERMSRMQARVVLGALVVVLVGGAAELSRSPQLVSFSGPDRPMAFDGRSLPSGIYQPVVFHPQPRSSTGGFRSDFGDTRVTGVKAAASSAQALKPLNQEVRRRRPSVASPGGVRSVRSERIRATVPRAGQVGSRAGQRWVVLTTWRVGDVKQPRILFSETGERVFSHSYAAVPTAAGWLVFQL